MKRHQCRHCGLAFDTCAELQRHVQCHSTPSWDVYSYSVAPPTVVPPSDHAKRAKYVCEKCGGTFGRLDNLQRHVRLVCSSSSSRRNTTVYTCKKCGRKFERRRDLTRHSRTKCTDVTEPPAPKRSKREDTTPPHHPLVTEKDPIEPPDRLPFSDTLSTELLDVVRNRL